MPGLNTQPRKICSATRTSLYFYTFSSWNARSLKLALSFRLSDSGGWIRSMCDFSAFLPCWSHLSVVLGRHQAACIMLMTRWGSGNSGNRVLSVAGVSRQWWPFPEGQLQVQSVAGSDNRLGLSEESSGRRREEQGGSVSDMLGQPTKTHQHRDSSPGGRLGGAEPGLGYQIIVHWGERRERWKELFIATCIRGHFVSLTQLRCNCDKLWDDGAL